MPKKVEAYVLDDIKYGNNGIATWGTVNAYILSSEEPVKLRAHVIVKAGDIFNKRLGEALVKNVLERKALDKAVKKIKEIQATTIAGLKLTDNAIQLVKASIESKAKQFKHMSAYKAVKPDADAMPAH